jgi:hypothetical protein
MAIKIAAVTFDCHDALVVGRFWSAALDRPLDPRSTSEFTSIGMLDHRDTRGWQLDEETTWLFAKVPEPKIAKNRMHLDVAAPDIKVEIERLIELGATRLIDMNEWGYVWTVMQDPEGNEFCVAELR